MNRFLSEDLFEFGNHLDPGKLAAIVATHLLDDDDEQLYLSFLHRLRYLYAKTSNTFDSAWIDFKLCEFFTAQSMLLLLS